MVIFNSYVKLPEGIGEKNMFQTTNQALGAKLRRAPLSSPAAVRLMIQPEILGAAWRANTWGCKLLGTNMPSIHI
jgi:hypothetical protein